MSEAATQLIAAFEMLPPKEQHEVIAALLRRSTQKADDSLTGDQLDAIADEAFLALDREEEHGRTAEPR